MFILIALNTHSLPQFIPPPSQGEVRWGVGGSEPAPTALLHPIAFPVIPAQAGIHCAPSMVGGAGAASVGRRDIKARIEAEVAQVPACAGMTEKGAGMTEKGAGMTEKGGRNDGEGGQE